MLPDDPGMPTESTDRRVDLLSDEDWVLISDVMKDAVVLTPDRRRQLREDAEDLMAEQESSRRVTP